ncbi:MAG: SIS domain-containing protein [Cytophagaceae bacterium]|nr:SIS domain-containing protein [Cytophagaceae bacterium]
MHTYLTHYIQAQKTTFDAIPLEQVNALIQKFREALDADQQIFVFGNGGSAASASHFITDLSKGASDKLTRRFRAMSLNDNVAWMTALGNDYGYDDVYLRQLMNFARPGDMVMTMSVSGNSPNLVKAFEWAQENGLDTVALVGGNRGKLAELADFSIVIHDTHYGRVEDAHMAICHMICYAFMENAV